MIVNPTNTAVDSRLPICLPFTLAMECPFPSNWSDPRNFSNDPHDPGGRTMDGIIQNEYDFYRKMHSLPVQDVLLISEAEGWDIYENSYWEPKCVLFPPGMDLSFFDTEVNCGSFGATKILQRSLGVGIDGLWGPFTNAAVQDITDVIDELKILEAKIAASPLTQDAIATIKSAIANVRTQIAALLASI